MARVHLLPAEQSAIADIAARCKLDPLLWAETAWDWGHGDLKGKDIRHWQADVMDTIARHLADPAKRRLRPRDRQVG